MPQYTRIWWACVVFVILIYNLGHMQKDIGNNNKENLNKEREVNCIH